MENVDETGYSGGLAHVEARQDTALLGRTAHLFLLIIPSLNVPGIPTDEAWSRCYTGSRFPGKYPIASLSCQ